MLFPGSSHFPPLLLNFERLFFDIGIAGLLGLAGLGPALIGLAIA